MIISATVKIIERTLKTESNPIFVNQQSDRPRSDMYLKLLKLLFICLFLFFLNSFYLYLITEYEFQD